MNYKKLIAGVMAVTLMGSGTFLSPDFFESLSAFAFEADEIIMTYDYYYMYKEDGTLKISDSTKGYTEKTVPSMYGIEPIAVTEIGTYAFYEDNLLTKVVLSPGIEKIDDHAFYCCKNLTSVVIPPSVTEIHPNAFVGSNSVKIYAEIGSYAESYAKNHNMMPKYDYSFTLLDDGTIRISEYNDSDTEVTIPSTIAGRDVTEIDAGTFWNCKMTSLTIPSTVRKIETGAFADSVKIESIEVDENNLYYASKDGVLYDKDFTQLICFPPNSTITSYTIPEGVTTIYWNAFNTCPNLKKVIIPDSVIDIDKYAFVNCPDLKLFANSCSYAEDFIKKSDMTTTVTTDSYKYTFVSEDTICLDKYICNDSEIVVPDTIDGFKVVEIGEQAFPPCTSVILPDSILSINSKAFYGQTTLSNIRLSKNLKRINMQAFDYSNLSSIKIPYGTKELNAPFMKCDSLTSIIIPNTVTYIATRTFESCDSVKIYGERGSYAEEVANAKKIPFVEAVYGSYVFSVLDDDTVSITGYFGSETNIVIPSEIQGKTVSRIEGRAFFDCPSIESVTIPDSVTSIGSLAFYPNESLTLYGEIGKIADIYASINNCKFVPYSNGFIYSKLSDGTLSIDEYVGSETEIVIPEAIGNSNVSTLGVNLFSNNQSITKVTIPEGVKTISARAFYNCQNLTELNIPSTVTAIGNYAFWGCVQLPDVTLPDTLRSIGTNAFTFCAEFTNITIPAGVSKISDNAFSLCTGLKTVTIADGVTSIGSGAFGVCTGLEGIEIPSSVTAIADDAFSSSKAVIIYCEQGSYAETYAQEHNIPYETNFRYKTLEDGTLCVEEYTGSGAIAEIPAEVNGKPVTKIGFEAFKDHSELTRIIIPASVTTIGDFAFANCTGIKSITLPADLTSLGNGAFSGCTGLGTISLPAGITSIGMYTFDGCTGLTRTITIPDGVTSIGLGAFYGCEKIKLMKVPASVTSIATNAFKNCTAMTMCVENGSYAETYAKNNNIPYSIEISGTTVNISCPANMTEEITVQFIRKSDGQVVKQEVVTPSNGSAQVSSAGLNGDYIVTFSSATYTASSVSLSINSESKTVAVTMAPCPVVASASLTLDGAIGVNIKAEIPDEFANCQAVLYYDGKTTAAKSVKVSSVTKDSNGRYVFTFPVAAKEIADNVSFELYDPNNQKMKIVKGTSKKAIDNNCFQYAAMDYINSKKSSSDTKLASLCKALSDFGNASRIMFNYNTEGAKIEQSLSGVTAATLKPYELVRDEACVDGIKISSASLIIESETTINIKFKTTKSSISGYTFTCDGKKVTPTKIGEGEYQVQVTNISAADLDKAHTFSVSDGKNTQKITYSALSYAYSKISSTDTKLSNLVKTLYLYNKAAKSYLGK